jgi:hypothetical protein
MRTYASNMAGFWWGVGSFAQLILGGIILSPREITAAIFNIASPSSYLFFGHGDRGVKAGAVFGEIGTFLTLYPELLKGNIPAWIGFSVFTTTVTIYFFSGELTERFEHSKNFFLHHTFGNPRRVSLVTAASRLPIIIDSFISNDWHIFVPYIIWLLGDMTSSFSKSEKSYARQKRPTP